MRSSRRARPGRQVLLSRGALIVSLGVGACTLLSPSDEDLFGAASGNGGGLSGRAGSAGTGGRSGGGGAPVSGASTDGGVGGASAGEAGQTAGFGEAGGSSGNGGAAGEAGMAGGSGVPACDPGWHLCSETCVRSDSVESCGTRCAPCTAPDHGRATCNGSACGVSCDVGFSPCTNQCVDLKTDPAHCGGCGVACSGDAVCQASRCVSVSGCSDGSREGFAVSGTYLAIAGCGADWPMGSLRAPKTGTPCGRGLAVCAVPADACGLGWHVCAAPPYGPTEVSSRATVAECLAQPGSFAIAVGDQRCDPCTPDGDGAACCGTGCVQQNGSCIYPNMTAWVGVIAGHKNVCTAVESQGRGVLCCRDQ